MNRQIIKLVTIILGGFILVTTYQNCAPNGFSGVPISEQEWTGSSIQLPEPIEKKLYPSFQLMSGNQIYQSYLQLTQVPENNTTRAEFQRRRSSFSDQGDPSSINSPYLLAQLSLAGEVCAQLTAREAALAANQRRFYQTVNFNQGLVALSNEAIQNVVRQLFQELAKTEAPRDLIQDYLDMKAVFLDGTQDSTNLLRQYLTATCSTVLGSVANSQL
jgi:hypothetical protein